MDKGYTDFETLYSFSKSNCFFVIRAKNNLVYYRRYSHPIDKNADIRSDQTIQLTGPKTSILYPIPLRRITFRDEEQHRTFVFLTNHFQLDIDYLSALQTAMADRIVLQMDQAASANKIVFRNIYQRSQDADMDSDQCLRACGDNQKGVETGAFITRNTPNYKCPAFRENTAKTSTYGKLL
jgi:hypothetical protein